MKVVLLFDLSSAPPLDQDYSSYLKDAGWRSEMAVKRAIESVGHEAIFVGVYDNIPRLIQELTELKPDLVFNMAESFRNNRHFEPQIAGVLELLNLPFTGTGSFGLGLCKDKSLTKKILGHHKIPVPHSEVSKLSRPLRSLKKFSFPAFVKLVKSEASEGISLDSFVEDEEQCLARADYLHKRFKEDVLIEEFILGRDIYVSVLGNKRLQVLPFRQLQFSRKEADGSQFATYKTKWDEAYRKRWGVKNTFAPELSGAVLESACEISKKAFEALNLSGFARFDFRLTDKDALVMLEANPNPSISDDDDFVLSAKKAGLTFNELIEKIMDIGWAR